MRKSLIAAMLVVSAAAVAGGASPWPSELKPPRLAEERLSRDRFAAVHQAVQPPAEAWLEVGWETELEVARRRAAAENKPIFMWVMDGHPLGCT
jgi:hypothetical protein